MNNPKIILDEINLSYNQDPVCPYCGHIERDAWELDLEDEEDCEIECNRCEMEYIVSLHVSISYSTYKKDGDL